MRQLSSSTYVVINEVTTAATALAMGQFFTTTFGITSTNSFGSSTTNSTGLTNAFSMVNNLVNTSTGTAMTTLTLGSITAVPEYNKLNAFADVLAACVNTTSPSSTPCTTLFTVATPSTTKPTDTLQAAVDMSLNPTSSATTTSPATLWSLATATPPFSYCLQGQPTDWTVGILYTDGTTSLNDPQNVAADAAGNIWVVNHNGTASASLTELSGGANGTIAVGTPQVNVSTIGGHSMSAIQPRNEAIDTNGNVWIDAATSAAYDFEYNATTPSSSIALADPTNKAPYGIAIDGSNNVFITHENPSSTFSVLEFLGGTLATTSVVKYPVYNPGATQQPEYAAVDASGNLWMTNGSSTSGLYNNIFQMSAFNGAVGGVCNAFPCNVGTSGDTTPAETYTNMVSGSGSIPTLDKPYGIAAGPGGVVWTANTLGVTLTQMTSNTAGTDFGPATSLTAPAYVAVDGAGNVWVSDKTISAPASVSEFSSTGTILSPINSGGSFTAVGFSHSGINTAQGITLDPSGNVWVANQTATTGGVFEIVGAGAPTDTPIAKSLADGKVGVKP
jgi:hypothetical protein